MSRKIANPPLIHRFMIRKLAQLNYSSVTAYKSVREQLFHVSYLPDIHQLLHKFIKLLGFYQLTTRQIIAGFLHHVTGGLI